MLCHVLRKVTAGLGKVNSVRSEIIKVVWPRKMNGWNDILRTLLELKFKARRPAGPPRTRWWMFKLQRSGNCTFGEGGRDRRFDPHESNDVWKRRRRYGMLFALRMGTISVV